MKSKSVSFSKNRMTAKSLLISIVIYSLVVIYPQINLTYGFMILTDQANSTLKELDKNQTTVMISLAVKQINDSRGPDPEENLRDLDMARSTLHDVIEFLSIGSGNVSLNTEDPEDHDSCREQTTSVTDCVIGDVRFALDSLNVGETGTAIQVLERILNNVA
jgi:hypothetical protein